MTRVGERKPYLLRIPPELWDDLNRWAGEELRSVNGQIEWILRRAVEERRGAKAKPKRPGGPTQAR